MLRLQPSYQIVESGQPGNSSLVEIAAYNYVSYNSERREILIYHCPPRR